MIKRKLLSKIRDHLNAREITLLVGPRQIGKTTLLKTLQKELTGRGERTLFFNLDVEEDARHFASQQHFIRKVQLELGKKRGYVFIDEIQRKEDSGLFLKGLFDLDLPYKLIVSGSGSLELKEKIKESLVGRKRMFELLPVTFEEFIHYKTGYQYENNLHEFLRVEKPEVDHLLSEYLDFGGYPRIVTEGTLEEKKLLMNEIFESYVERDVVYLLKVARPEVFRQLIQLLSANVGQILNYSNLAAITTANLKTLKKYLWIAEKTFIIYPVLPFFRNVKKEISRAPVVYFFDTGMRNFAIHQFGTPKTPTETGFLFQNFVINQIKQRVKEMGWQVKYWRTKDMREIDMILDKFQEQIPIEIKYVSYKTPKVPKAMYAFIKKYMPTQAWIINLSLRQELTWEKTKIRFIPYVDLLLPETFG